MSEQDITNDQEIVDEVDEIESPMSKENKKILQSRHYEGSFHEIFLELLDIGKGYHNAKESFTQALLNAGSTENPQSVYQYIDLLTQRLESFHIVKRLCHLYGLHAEMDKIMDREMDLIYKHPQTSAKQNSDQRSMPIAGEFVNRK